MEQIICAKIIIGFCLLLIFFKFVDDYFQLKKDLKRAERRNRTYERYIFGQK